MQSNNKTTMYKADIQLKCKHNDNTVTFNLKSNLVIDKSKSLEQIEKDIMHDMKLDYKYITECNVKLKMKLEP